MLSSHDELSEHFPGNRERISALMSTDKGFRSLCASYRQVLDATRKCATDAVFTDRRKVEELRRARQTLAEAISASLHYRRSR